ncbi:MAG: phospho-N-acetylmuramoyl-pentapeptide-transferase [Anaerolineae bacterium]|nr:phospho-N-acetylmuramoyl-pentapeptide-transferase [Anaerolineae bacterium]
MGQLSAPQMGICLMAGGAAFVLTLLLGPAVIHVLKKARIGKRIRIDGPASHYVKAGTPTMGGVMFILPTVLLIGVMYAYTRLAVRIDPALVQFVLVGNSIAVPIFVLLGFAALGAVDDYMGVIGIRRGEGMRGRSKALIQLIIAVAAALVMNLAFGVNRVGIPGISDPIALGLAWIPVAVFIIHASANAVNLTDGLDGLAALIVSVAFVAYGVIAYMQGQVFITMLCMVLVGSLLGFLWFNIHPAQVMMGDLGSEALGGVLGVVALMTGQWLLLPIIAIVPMAETLSVILQVGYFKYTKRKYGEGRRLFKMSPLHNHFVLLGWSEPQIVQRFFVIALFFGMVGIGLASFGNPPMEEIRAGRCLLGCVSAGGAP